MQVLYSIFLSFSFETDSFSVKSTIDVHLAVDTRASSWSWHGTEEIRDAHTGHEISDAIGSSKKFRYSDKIRYTFCHQNEPEIRRLIRFIQQWGISNINMNHFADRRSTFKNYNPFLVSVSTVEEVISISRNENIGNKVE